MNLKESLQFDGEHLWHPYAALKNTPARFLAKEAHGTTIETADGLKLIDAVSSWWCMAHGHNAPEIVQAIQKQSEKMCHVMFGGFTHEPAIELGEKLVKFLPQGLNKIFFADSGSIAVECAAKMAVQYQYAKGHPEKCKLVALKGGYHGDTAGAMALSDPDGMHTLFKGIMTKHFFAEKPSIPTWGEWNDADAESLRSVVDEHGGEIAAVICEPVFQAANAMNFYHPEYLREMRRLCDERGMLLVFDEIAAGFYRTGPLWAHSRAGITPDIMTVGKALTGGHMTLAATLASGKVADTISGGRPSAFMHGPTYMANPLACAAACASLGLFAKGDYAADVARIERQFREGLGALRGRPNVRDVRVLGAAGVVEVERLPAQSDISRVIREHGVWLRPFSNFIYSMPPLVADEATVDRIVGALVDLASAPPGPPPEDGDFHE
jgi:adenosylmethionine-8-amino-7-oxononanoate aminotransferase